MDHKKNRIKGPVRFADRVVMLNFVSGKSEWMPWKGESQTQLAFIGWDINSEEILKKSSFLYPKIINLKISSSSKYFFDFLL
jgi:hypothetical protein